MTIDEQTRQSRSPKRNVWRRGLGAVVCFAPVFILVSSFAYSDTGRSTGRLGFGLAVVALAIGALNSYLSFARPLLYRLRQSSMEGYRHVSGAPLIGTVFVLAAGVAGFGELPATIVALVAAIIDTGGLPWFLISTWRDESLWDA